MSSNQWHRGGQNNNNNNNNNRGGYNTNNNSRGARNNNNNTTTTTTAAYNNTNNNNNKNARRDLLKDDFGQEFPLWELTSYAAGQSKPNLLGGDTSPEELRFLYGNALADNQRNAEEIERTFEEYKKLKKNDRDVLKNMPEEQLVIIFENVDGEKMKPAGVERVLHYGMCHRNALDGKASYMKPSALGINGSSNSNRGGVAMNRQAFGGGGTGNAQQAFGGINGDNNSFGGGGLLGFGSNNNNSLLRAGAPPFGNPQQSGGLQQQQPSSSLLQQTPPAVGFGNNNLAQRPFTSSSPVVTITPVVQQTTLNQQNGFLPDFNAHDPFGSRDFALGSVPDAPPPAQFCT